MKRGHYIPLMDYSFISILAPFCGWRLSSQLNRMIYKGYPDSFNYLTGTGWGCHTFVTCLAVDLYQARRQAG